MPTVAGAHDEQIRRRAERQPTAQTRTMPRTTARHRRDTADLKRQVAAPEKPAASPERKAKRRVAERPAAQGPSPAAGGLRFRPDAVRSHRAELGLSAHDYGRLVGVAELAIRKWDRGMARPRPDMLARLAAVRGLDPHGALRRLRSGGWQGSRYGVAA